MAHVGLLQLVWNIVVVETVVLLAPGVFVHGGVVVRHVARITATAFGVLNDI